jgi:hypothetical protein
MAEIISSFKELRAYQEAGVRGQDSGVRSQGSWEVKREKSE